MNKRQSCTILNVFTLESLKIPITLGCPFYDDYYEEIFKLDDEVRNHYRNDIDNDVYSPLVHLRNNEPGYNLPVWRRRLGRPNRIDESFLNTSAIYHLNIDSPRLLTEIRENQNQYNRFVKNMETLPLMIV
jgi:hypothetical protein